MKTYSSAFEQGMSIEREGETLEIVLTQMPDGEQVFTLATLAGEDNPNHDLTNVVELDLQQVRKLRALLNDPEVSAILDAEACAATD